MSVYIYTLPKAGTYFIAQLLSNLGLHDTGLHLSSHEFLDTKRFTLEQNAMTPEIAAVEGFFVPVVRRMGPQDILFGHFPLPRNLHVALPDMKYICSYRSPEKTLISEFIDFRFRRSDVPWLSPEEVPDDATAFEVYLEQHGLGTHLDIFKCIVVYHSTVNHPLERTTEREKVCFVHFETLLEQPGAVRQIAAFLEKDISLQEAEAIHQKTLAAETKTKATGLTLDRAALWSDRARQIFAESEFPAAIALAREQGLQV